MTTLARLILAGHIDAPDVFCGGTPCTSFSVAGLRQSLAAATGQLTYTFCEIANAIDATRTSAGMRPSVVLWENVPGVLSTRDNAFGCFLAGLAGDDCPVEPGPRPEQGRSSFHWRWQKDTRLHRPKWPQSGMVIGPRRTVAWRLLNAEYFGLAQHRERVFVVASAHDGIHPAEVLFERESVYGDHPPSRESRKNDTFTTVTCAAEPSQAPSIISHGIPGNWIGRKPENGGNSTQLLSERAPALTSTDRHGVICIHGTQDPNTRSECAHALGRNQGGENAILSVGEAHTVALRGRAGGSAAEVGGVTANCLRASQGGGDKPYVLNSHVRRLLPRECERLMGFPDGYTAIPFKGRPAADSHRYAALGNSWPVPVVQWIGRRINQKIGEIA